MTSWVATCVSAAYLFLEVRPVLEDAFLCALDFLRLLKLLECVSGDLECAFEHVVAESVLAGGRPDVVRLFALESRKHFEEEAVHGELRGQEAWVSRAYRAPA